MAQSLVQTLTSLSPYHLLFYSTLLGTELYQTFVITSVTFNSLPLGVFMNLNKKTFPLYFRIQTLLTAATVLTYPPAPGLLMVVWDMSAAIVRHRKDGGSSLSREGRWSTLDVVAMLLMSVTTVLNLVVYGPKSQRAMTERSHQGKPDPYMLYAAAVPGLSSFAHIEISETRDLVSTRGNAAVEGPSKSKKDISISPELKKARRYFSRMHAMSIHLNLIAIIGTLLYGVSLAGRFEFSTSG